MQVILIEDIKGLGKKLEIINVSEGYGRNYLIPRGLAKLADAKNVLEAKSKKEAMQFKKETEKENAEKLKNKIENTRLEFRLKAKNGKPYGNVTTKEISDKLYSLGITIDKKKIEFNQAISNEGAYVAKVKLHQSIEANVMIQIKYIG